ncbi:MAG TPA: ABC transporter ATP-binding protein [Fibrobacteres bacterium]|jgi:branched-chain amino acid transport system ATP-binding protein|nr:ABC transporter ATP-binding protein [Fibrobacterota bacterium]
MSEHLLSLRRVSCRYGAVRALTDIHLKVDAGEIVTLIGANGAGKSTLLKAIVSRVRPDEGEILFEGTSLLRKATHEIAAMGIALVPEGRAVFGNLTVLENLEMGGYLRSKSENRQSLEHAFAIFPRLRERVRQAAGTLSGGEQQMLAIGRALMAKPRLLLLDEPSLGIAPILVRTIYEAIDAINREGMTILVVEQNAHLALKHSHRAYVLETGRVVMEGSSREIANDPKVKEAYLGEI